MQISRTLSGLTGGGSDGWELFLRARQMVAEGIEVIELTIGEHDIRTDPQILAAMNRSALGGHTGYAPVPGTASLRRAVAARVSARTGQPTGPEHVLITAGGQAALFAAHLAACDPGDAALFIDPYYATYPGTIRAVGARPVPVTALPENGFQPRAQDIADAAQAAHRPRALMINSPNNPTGAVYSASTMAAIAGLCRDLGLWLISDEVYDTQVWAGVHHSPRALDGMAERTLVVGSMSKSHAMTGSRCGWIVGPPQVIDHLSNLATHTTYGVAGFVQDAAEFALAAGPALEEQISAPFRRRRALALEIIGAQNVVRAAPPDGAMYLMLDIRACGLSGKAFAEALLAQERIAVMPGESFGDAAAGHLRVAMTVGDEAFVDALERLCAFAARLAG